MQLPPVLQSCKSIFDKLVVGQFCSGTDLLAVNDNYPASNGLPKETVRRRVEDLPRDLSRIFPSLPRKVSFLTHVQINGIPYSVHSKNVGNSSIMVVSDNGHQTNPHVIERIVQYPDKPEKVVLLTRPHLPASGILSQVLHMVAPSTIDGHFAKCPTQQEEDVIIVLPLSRNIIMDPKYQTDLQDEQMDIDNFHEYNGDEEDVGYL
ncbi:uncharacterized protein ARMOST_02347 [Armillaria ostoyae]|uniref:Uncharacterized protein n=1 Tax=Armillaria ostoyae TaxID=47428 RepID=A0A284QRG6_ARMOS|nr:uncharacterized protein ARMOST_02347 [Armillaria ostoyae]